MGLGVELESELRVVRREPEVLRTTRSHPGVGRMSTTSYLKSFQEEHIIVIAVLIIISICTGSIITTIRHHAGSLLLTLPCRRPDIARGAS